MTDEQCAELQELNAAIAAAPDDGEPYERRARLRAQTDCELSLVVADCESSLRVHLQAALATNKAGLPKLRERILGNGKDYWKSNKTVRTILGERLCKAKAVAAFSVVLEFSPDLQSWRAKRPADWSVAPWLHEIAALDLNDLPASWLQGTPEDWEVLALALGVIYGYVTAAKAFTHALRIAAKWRHRQIPARWYARRARRFQTESYRQLGWWNLAVESEPDDPQWLVRRAQFFNRRHHHKAAERDMARAIALAPDEPHFYELRAKLCPCERWWDLSEGAISPAADMKRAIELRLARGQFSGAPAALLAQAEKFKATLFNFKRSERERPRAYAYYSLAIEARPDDAALYLARAALAEPVFDIAVLLDAAFNYQVCPGAYPDYIRALALDPTLVQAGAAIVKYLSHALKDDTHHQQIEALLDARQTLRDRGLDESLVSAMLAEVERHLATGE